MSTEEFWGIVIVVGAFLWWLSFVATKRMRVGKNLEREEIARRNLERHAREQAELAAQNSQSEVDEAAAKVPDSDTKEVR